MERSLAGLDAGSQPADCFFDACSLLNLFGSRRCEDVLRAVPGRATVGDRVASETIYVFRGGGGPDARDREPVDLLPLIEAGLLRVTGLETDSEAAAFVSLAAELDDGEALTCALAIHRGGAVATDDRKALRVLRDRAPHVATYTTSQIIKQWSDGVNLPDAELRRILVDVQERANFVPSRRDPLQGWWGSIGRAANA